ncbi:hypothetical protein V490_05288 [Pseudogymnoascus sp. VKM F-3557]|nr:hypothetical protein V490_05288 [Pseudogymnoascus sp. VKM F-3557]
MPSPQEWPTPCPCDEATMKPSTLWAIQTAGLTVGTSYGYTLTAAARLPSQGVGDNFALPLLRERTKDFICGTSFALIGIRSNVRSSPVDLGTYFELSSKEPTTPGPFFTLMMATMFSAPVGEAYNFLPDQKNFCFGQGSRTKIRGGWPPHYPDHPPRLGGRLSDVAKAATPEGSDAIRRE